MAHQLIGADLRQHPRTRIPAPFPCSFLPIEVPSWWDGSSHGLGVVFDLSLNGMKLMSDTLPPTGEQVALLVRLPHQRTPLTVDVATVRWRTPPTVGLEFTSLSEFATMRLRKYIEGMSMDRTGPMSDVAQEDDSWQGTATCGFLSLDPRRPEELVEASRPIENIPKQVPQEQPIAEIRNDVPVPVARTGEEPVSREAGLKPGVVKVRQRMYRSRTSPLVRWGMFLLALLVLYQAWWKPFHQLPLQLPTPSVRPSAVSPPPIPSLMTKREEPTPIPETQIVVPGPASNSSLTAIQTVLGKKEDGVESGSRKFAKEVSVDADANPQPSSQRPLVKIRKPVPHGRARVAVAGLSQVSAGKKVGVVPPALNDPSRVLGPVSIPSGIKADSAPHTAASPQPRTRDTSHFTVVFEGGEDSATWIRMRAILDYAYQEISSKFGYVPVTPIKVVVHMHQQFLGETGTPAWADTLFDQGSGAVHIPAGHALDDLAWFSRVVRHEFVHALLYARMNQQMSVVPTWLVEGLAIGLAEDSWSDLDEVRTKRPPFIPLASLQGRWHDLPSDALPVAYMEADLATRSLTDRYGIYGVRQVLNVMRAGQSLDSAMGAKLSLSYDTFQRQWAKDVNLHLRPDVS